MNQGNNNNHNKNRKNNNNSKYAHLKHTHVPRILQNNMPAFFDVYTPESDAVYNIAARDIIHLPNDYQEHYSKGHNQHNNHRLILCPHFHNKDLSRYHHYHHQEGEQQTDDYEKTLPFCPHGDQCSNVHAHLENARVNNDIHVNFAYKNLQEVKYPRYGSNCADGASLRIAPPNQTAPVEDLSAHLCIQTNAYIGRDRITSHCAHYFYNRVCLRGSKCFFVHAVSLEPVSSSTNNKSNKNNNKSTVENNTNTFDENKINNTYQEGCFHVDPQFRRIYGRTEPLRRQQNNNNHHQTQGHHYNNSSSSKKQQLEQLQQPLQPTHGHQSFFAAAFSQNQHQQPQQQQRNIITKKTSFTDSYASSPSSHHDDFEESEETMMMIPDEHLDEIACNNHHHQQQQHQQQPQHQQYHQLQSSSSSSCTPRMLCQGCRKFVHNPYSWTQTTVCLARTSPVSPSTPASH